MTYHNWLPSVTVFRLFSLGLVFERESYIAQARFELPQEAKADQIPYLPTSISQVLGLQEHATMNGFLWCWGSNTAFHVC